MIFCRVKPYLGANQQEIQRDRHWKILAAAWISEHPTCAACGSRHNVQVHHIFPLSTHPHLELEPSNLITLCRSYDYGVNCHLYHGHLGDWSRSNPNVITDAAAALRKLTIRTTDAHIPHPSQQVTVDPHPLAPYYQGSTPPIFAPAGG